MTDKGHLKMTGVTLADGFAEAYGGSTVIRGSGSKGTFQNCTFTSNRAGSGDGDTSWGGAIFIRSGGEGTFTNCNFSSNKVINRGYVSLHEHVASARA